MTQHQSHSVHANSIAAHQEERSAGRLSKRCAAIMEALSGYRPLTDPSLTDRQIMEALSLPDRNCVAPRVTEMVGEGILEEAGSAVDHVTGKTVRLVRIKRKADNLSLF